MSTKQLQLVCLELCIACRQSGTSCVVVTPDTPPHLWRWRDSKRHPIACGNSRLPILRVSTITWKRSIAQLAKDRVLSSGVPMNLVSRPQDHSERRDNVWQSPSFQQLQRLSIVPGRNEAIDNIEWPASLLQRALGPYFNFPIDSVGWPVSLEVLEFGDDFNQSFVRVVWPVYLRHVIFGRNFNFLVESVVWPVSLEVLELGDNFNQSLVRAVLPASLQADTDIWKELQQANRPCHMAYLIAAPVIRVFL